MIAVLLLLLAQADQVLAQATDHGRNSMMAESPFTTYTAGVVIYVFLIAVLVTILLIGGFLAVNLGMMSKRGEDRVGGRTPSDVGILKSTLWPEVPESRKTLPAEEDISPMEAIDQEATNFGSPVKDRERQWREEERIRRAS